MGTWLVSETIQKKTKRKQRLSLGLGATNPIDHTQARMVSRLAEIKDVHKVNGGHFLNSTIAESKYETYCLAKTICQFRHVGFPTHFNTHWNT